MFLDLDRIQGQISAAISIYSQSPKDYENMHKLHEMLKKSVVEIGEALNSENEEGLTVLLDMLEYQIGKINKLRSDRSYKDRVLKRGKYAPKSRKK